MLTKVIESLSSKKKAIEKEVEELYKDPYEDLLTTQDTDYEYNWMLGTNMASTGGYTNSSGVYTITTGTSASTSINTGGLGTGSYTWNATASINPTVTMSGATINDHDITITRKDKPSIKVAATLDLLIEALYIIVPDEQEHNNNPALKSAYEEWQYQFAEQTKRMSPLKEAYDSYMMMKKLCREEEEE